MYVDTYLRTYVPTYLPTYLPTYVPTYLHTYLPTYLHTYVPTYVRMYMYICIAYVYEDCSTNGTWVNEVKLSKGRNTNKLTNDFETTFAKSD